MDKYPSKKMLPSKYTPKKYKFNYLPLGYEDDKQSTSNQILLSIKDDVKNGQDSELSAVMDADCPELVTIIEENPLLMPIEKRTKDLKRKNSLRLPKKKEEMTSEIDLLQLPMQTSQVAIAENNILQISTETPKVQPSDTSCIQPGDWLKIHSLFGVKEKNKKNSLPIKNKIKDDKNLDRGPLKNKCVPGKINEMRKRLLDIEEARNEREQIMLQIEIERNEREKRIFFIEEEKNEREKRFLQFKADKIEQYERILQIKAKRFEQNERIIKVKTERNKHNERILNIKTKRKTQNERILELENKRTDLNKIIHQFKSEKNETVKLITRLKKERNNTAARTSLSIIDLS